MMSRLVIAFLAGLLTLTTGCHHSRCCGHRRPMFRGHGSACCEPTSCCGYAAPAPVVMPGVPVGVPVGVPGGVPVIVPGPAVPVRQ